MNHVGIGQPTQQIHKDFCLRLGGALSGATYWQLSALP